MVVELQTQIYIVAGVFGAGVLLLLILVVVLFDKIARLKRQLNDEKQFKVNTLPLPIPTVVSPGHGHRARAESDLLQKRGYNEFKGSPDTSAAPPPREVRQSSMTRSVDRPVQSGPSSYIKQQTPPAHGYSRPTSTTGTPAYGKGYENQGFERDHHVTGVRVLPSLPPDHGRRANYENSYY